jgi:TonB-dependent receptor
MKCKTSFYESTAIALALAGFAVSAVPAQAQASQTIETVVVLGVRGSQEKSVDLKRNAASIQDSIVAEDIGKLPDATITDSLQRIPGVQIDKSAGEGAQVVIRGLPQVSTMLNGEEFLGANSITTVQPNFGDIPSQLFSGADVIKSPTGNMLIAGITGTIDLKTRRPLDLPSGWTATVAAESAWGAKTHKFEPQVNGLVGYNAGRFGLLASASYADVTLANYYNGETANDDTGKNASWAGYKYDVWGPGDPTATAGNRYFSFEGHEADKKTTERKRFGANVSGQADLGGGFVATVDGFYTKQIEFNRKVGFTDESKWQTWNGFTPIGAVNTGFLDTSGNHIFTTPKYELHTMRLKSHTEENRYDSDSTNINFQLAYDDGGKFTGSIRAVYGEAVQHNINSYADIDMANGSQWGIDPSDYPTGFAHPNPAGYAGIPVVDVAYGKSQTWSNLPAFLSNEAGYNIGAISSENNYDRTATLRAIRAEGKYQFDTNFSVDAGVRFSSRTAGNNQYNLFAPFYAGHGASNAAGCLVKWKATDVVMSDSSCWAGSASTFAANDAASPKTFYTALKPTPLSSFGNSAIFVKDFGPVKGIPGVWALDPKIMDNPLAFNNSLFPGNVKLADPGATYKVGVSQESGYVQANFSGNGAVPYQANVGIRVVQTDLDIIQHLTGAGRPYSGTNIDAGTFETKRSFIDFLPAVNFSADIQEDLKFRFGYAKTMTMLDLQQWGGGLSPVYTIDTTSPVGSPTYHQFIVASASSLGNPSLDPWRADAYNASLEWYLAPGSILNFDAFYFKIDSFIQSGVLPAVALPDADGVVRRTVAETTNVQVSGGELHGFEVAYRQTLDFLPGLLRGLGIDTNYTYAPSNAGYKDLQGATVPLQDNAVHSANFIVWYQLEGLQARVAYNYRSKRAATQDDIWGATHGLTIYQKPASYIDASVSYDITPNFTAYVQGSNLGGEKVSYYFQFPGQYCCQSAYERRLVFGVRGRL